MTKKCHFATAPFTSLNIAQAEWLVYITRKIAQEAE